MLLFPSKTPESDALNKQVDLLERQIASNEKSATENAEFQRRAVIAAEESAKTSGVSARAAFASMIFAFVALIISIAAYFKVS